VGHIDSDPSDLGEASIESTCDIAVHLGLDEVADWTSETVEPSWQSFDALLSCGRHLNVAVAVSYPVAREIQGPALVSP